MIVSAPPSVGDVHVVVRRLDALRPRTCAAGRRRSGSRPAKQTLTRSAPSVPRTITVSGWPSPPPPTAARSASTVLASVPVRSLTAIVSAPPRARTADALDVVEVHDDVGDVAGEAHARAVGGDLDVLADVAAVEVEQVVAALALDGVVAVAGVPLEAVVAAAEERAGPAPWLPSTKSLPGPPSRMSAPLPPRRSSSPAPPSNVSCVSAREVSDGCHRVRAAEPEQDDALDRGGVELAGPGRERADVRSIREHVDRVVGRRAVVPGGVGAVAAVDVERDRAGDADGHRGRVGAAERRDDEVVERGLATGDVRLRPDAVDDRPAVRAGEGHTVCVLGAPGDDRVGLVVADAAEGIEVDVDDLDGGAGEVVDGGGVGAAEGADVDAFDAVEVHRDGADVAGQPCAVGVGGELDLLAGVGGVEVELVAAALPLDGVAGVAGIPLEAIVAGAELRLIGAEVAVSEVVPGAAEERVRPGAADQRVVAVAAVEREGLVGEGAAALVDADIVVAATGCDDDRGEGAAVEAEVGRPVRAKVGLECGGRARLEAEDEACRSPRRR